MLKHTYKDRGLIWHNDHCLAGAGICFPPLPALTQTCVLRHSHLAWRRDGCVFEVRRTAVSYCRLVWIAAVDLGDKVKVETCVLTLDSFHSFGVRGRCCFCRGRVFYSTVRGEQSSDECLVSLDSVARFLKMILMLKKNIIITVFCNEKA